MTELRDGYKTRHVKNKDKTKLYTSKHVRLLEECKSRSRTKKNDINIVKVKSRKEYKNNRI